MRLYVLLNQWVRDKQSRETLRKTEWEQKDTSPVKSASSILENFLIKGIDLKAGIKRYGSEKVYLNILRSYKIHAPDLLEKLRCLTRTTLPDYVITVHGLKGASYGICAGVIGKEAEELEYAAKAGDYEKVNAQNAAFIAGVETTLTDIGEILRRAGKNGSARKKTAAPDKVLLEKLLEASKHFKPTVMENVIEELEGWEYETGGELIPWLREQFENLEYDTIRAKLETAAVS
jgi:hypothetical protein